MIREVNVVYDVDDTLNNLNDYVFKTLGITQMPSQFNIRKCIEFTKEQQDSILSMYGKAETFRNLTFVPGATEICRAEKLKGISVKICSSNFSEEIADIKTGMLLKDIPGLRKENIHMQIGFGNEKVPFPNTLIVVDDCIEHIVRYPSSTVKIIIDKSYNKASVLGSTDKALDLTRVRSLEEANRLVRIILSIEIGYNNFFRG